MAWWPTAPAWRRQGGVTAQARARMMPHVRTGMLPWETEEWRDAPVWSMRERWLLAHTAPACPVATERRLTLPQPAGVGHETTARTDDGTLGRVRSQEVAQAAKQSNALRWGGKCHVGFQVHQRVSKSARMMNSKKMLKLGTPIEISTSRQQYQAICGSGLVHAFLDSSS